MKVLITGGAGFIGTRLGMRILQLGALTGLSGKPEKVDELVLFDVSVPATKPAGLDGRAKFVAGDIADQKTIAGLIDRDDMSVFHLASLVSGHGEQDFDLAMRVNLDGHRYLLEALRARNCKPRIVFASSSASFGIPAMTATVSDLTKQTPQTTYGMTKAIGEMFINDYTRKGFVDGRAARLPSVIVRPGKPNKAASSWASGVIREPLAGVECVLPVKMDTRHPVAGYRTVVDGFVRLHEVDGAAIGPDRAVNFPSVQITVSGLVEALKRVAGNRHLGAIRVEEDPFVAKIVAGWPTATNADRAITLGLPRDLDLDAIIKAYIEDYVDV